MAPSSCSSLSLPGTWQVGPRTPARGVFSAVLAALYVGHVLEASSLLFLPDSTASHPAFPRLEVLDTELVGSNFEMIHVLGKVLS